MSKEKNHRCKHDLDLVLAVNFVERGVDLILLSLSGGVGFGDIFETGVDEFGDA